MQALVRPMMPSRLWSSHKSVGKGIQSKVVLHVCRESHDFAYLTSTTTTYASRIYLFRRIYKTRCVIACLSQDQLIYLPCHATDHSCQLNDIQCQYMQNNQDYPTPKIANRQTDKQHFSFLMKTTPLHIAICSCFSNNCINFRHGTSQKRSIHFNRTFKI